MRISYKEAARRARGSASKWPARGGDNRLEPEAWPAVNPRFKLAPGQTVFSIGSCFARNIESRLGALGFNVPTAQFHVPAQEFPQGTGTGILNKYTAPSIFQELAWAADGGYSNDMIVQLAEGFVDLNLAGFRPVSQERAIERRRQLAALYQNAFTADVVVITFGLVEAWWDSLRQTYIQQTPSAPMVQAFPDRWQFESLDYQTTLDYARQAIQLLNRNPRPILITTSPTPLARSFAGQDAIIANTYAKSVLRAVCGALQQEFDNVDYFPSYESVMLTKSADVWQDDLIHIRPEFVLKVVHRMVSTFVDETYQLNEKLGVIQNQLEARRAAELELLNGSPATPQRFRMQKADTFTVVIGESEETIDFAPVEAQGRSAFACVLYPVSPNEVPATVQLEIFDANSNALIDASTTRVNGEQVRWRIGVKTPETAIVRLKFRKSGSGQSRLQVRRPRLVQ
jgi:hypothetical protein